VTPEEIRKYILDQLGKMILLNAGLPSWRIAQNLGEPVEKVRKVLQKMSRKYEVAFYRETGVWAIRD